jgi:predicted N-acyltransferase
VQKELVNIGKVKSFIFESITEVSQKDWDFVNNNQNIYLSFDYLLALEESMQSEMSFVYAVSYNADKTPVLIAAFQLVKFTTNKKKCPKVLLNKKPHNVSINLLICGNVFSNGENGFLSNAYLPPNQTIEELTIITKKIKKQLADQKISIVLFKEFSPSSSYNDEGFKTQNYNAFMVDVNMVLKLHSQWKTFEDYLFSMTTKYRTRIKGVYKKSKELVIKSLSAEEIDKYQSEITSLLEHVSKKAEYSYGVISVKAFILFKEKLKQDFILKALFLDQKIVGFSTSFYNNGQLDANYVGIDYEYNTESAVYQRLLCDYVEQSIERGVKELHFGRTSELVKSSLGAKPVNMKLYAKHKSAISNFLLKPIFNYITPSNFELRKPFKADFKY